MYTWYVDGVMGYTQLNYTWSIRYTEEVYGVRSIKIADSGVITCTCGKVPGAM